MIARLIGELGVDVHDVVRSEAAQHVLAEQDLVENQRYSYVFEGNSQVLDQMLVSDQLDKRNTSYDVVHVNAEFSDQASDHDPSVARFVFDDD